jgi:hypothetical protein
LPDGGSFADDEAVPIDLPYAQPDSTRPPNAAPALSPEQLNALAVGQALYQPIRRAVGYARFDGWSVAILAGLTAICSLTSPVTLLLGVGMGAVAWFELREAKRLAAGDVNAPRRLAYNQLALAGLLIGYAAWQLIAGVDTSELDAMRSQLGGDPAVTQMLDSLATGIPLVIYGTLIVAAVLIQGATALFYLSRRKAVEAYVRATPEWARPIVSR